MADIIKHPPHYFRFKIEPITFIMQNEIPYAEGNAINIYVDGAINTKLKKNS